jgi:hypothetical protein
MRNIMPMTRANGMRSGAIPGDCPLAEGCPAGEAVAELAEVVLVGAALSMIATGFFTGAAALVGAVWAREKEMSSVVWGMLSMLRLPGFGPDLG